MAGRQHQNTQHHLLHPLTTPIPKPALRCCILIFFWTGCVQPVWSQQSNWLAFPSHRAADVLWKKRTLGIAHTGAVTGLWQVLVEGLQSGELAATEPSEHIGCQSRSAPSDSTALLFVQEVWIDRNTYRLQVRLVAIGLLEPDQNTGTDAFRPAQTAVQSWIPYDSARALLSRRNAWVEGDFPLNWDAALTGDLLPIQLLAVSGWENPERSPEFPVGVWPGDSLPPGLCWTAFLESLENALYAGE